MPIRSSSVTTAGSWTACTALLEHCSTAERRSTHRPVHGAARAGLSMLLAARAAVLTASARRRKPNASRDATSLPTPSASAEMPMHRLGSGQPLDIAASRPLLGRRCRARGLRSARNAQRTPKGSTGACSLIDRHGAGARDPHAHPRRRSARDSPFLQGLKSLASSLHHDDHALAFVPLKRSSQDVRGVIGTTGE